MAKRKGPTPKKDRWGPWGEDIRSPMPDGSRLFGNGWWTVTSMNWTRPLGWRSPAPVDPRPPTLNAPRLA